MKAIGAIVASLVLSGAAISETINVPADYPTIQGAIDASFDGDLIQIEAGTYNEFNINSEGKAITIKGSVASDGSPTVIIDANFFGRVMVFDSGESSSTIIEDVLITNGFFPGSGGGIRCDTSSPTFRNCTIVNNSAQGNGGGIFCSNSNPFVIGCTISNNAASLNGGGIHCFDLSSPRLLNSIICSNTPDEIYGDFTDLGNNIISDTCSFLGACCIDSNCTLNNQEDCEEADGVFQGIGTDCDDDPCFIPPVEGACCTNDICRDAFEDDCLYWGGQWLGEGSTCNTTFCSTTCIGDANMDGVVNVNDILDVVAQFGVTCP